MDCRLILDPPGDGPRNMAVDEALLESAADGGQPTLRIYSWSEPTLSLGYFQTHADRQAHPASFTLPCVRRSSGGGALVHHHEVTYSLAMPASALRGRESRSLYCEAHRAVIDALADLGGDRDRMTLCQPATSTTPTEEPFLCFLRRADGDLLVKNQPTGDRPTGVVEIDGRGSPMAHKVGGSAQRKRHGGLLQHGGVLLRGSPCAPELPGLADLGIAAVEVGEFGPQFACKLGKRLDLRLTPGELSPGEGELCQQFRTKKYGSHLWTLRR